MESPNNHLSKFQQLQDKLTPEILGVFWATKKALIEKPQGFYSLDYFLDGLLSSYASQQADQDSQSSQTKKNFFIVKNFGVPFLVGHLSLESKKFHDDVHDFINMAKSISPNKKSIIVLNDHSKKSLNQLKKKYPTFKFIGVIL